MNKSCITTTFDVIIVSCCVIALCVIVSSIISLSSFEKSSLSSPSGYHLLSCPKLFEGDNGTLDFKNKYSDIRLSLESTEKLVSKLKESLEHSRVLHTGGDTVKESRLNRKISNALEEAMGGMEIDINVPRRVDNRNLCAVLVDILDEQIQNLNSQPSDAGAPYVSISIIKLDRSQENHESLLLRGSRLIRKAPLIEHMMRVAGPDKGLRDLLGNAKSVHLTDEFQGVTTLVA